MENRTVHVQQNDTRRTANTMMLLPYAVLKFLKKFEVHSRYSSNQEQPSRRLLHRMRSILYYCLIYEVYCNPLFQR